ncbi:hypothetical protein B0H14DRAFT_2583714 [Mycena olivaceomarginata]|nr:hypothetical protein B0H14DRAFT_2583714 [Mycena olivaceomarginata]
MPSVIDMFNFDYAIYTSNDPAPDSSSTVPTTSDPTSISSPPGPAPGPSSATSTSSTALPGSSSEKKVLVGAIAAGTVAGIAAIAAFLSILFLCRRARHRKTLNGAGEEDERPGASHPPTLPKETPDTTTALMAERQGCSPAAMAPEQDSVGIAEQLRALREEVQLLKQHAEGNTARSETNVSVGRSLSTMKREQTRVVQNQAGYSLSSKVNTNRLITL